MFLLVIHFQMCNLFVLFATMAVCNQSKFGSKVVHCPEGECSESHWSIDVCGCCYCQRARNWLRLTRWNAVKPSTLVDHCLRVIHYAEGSWDLDVLPEELRDKILVKHPTQWITVDKNGLYTLHMPGDWKFFLFNRTSPGRSK